MEPLSRTPNDESFLGHAAVRETIAALIGAVTAGSGTILLTGNPGTGKTTIVKRLERELRALGCTVVGFNCAGLEGSDGLVRTLSNDLGMTPPGGRIDRWLKSFHYFAKRMNRSGAPIVLVIDGAERLSGDLRSRLGQLLSPSASEPSGLRLILAGRPEILSHAELQPDHDLGRSIRLDRRLEWLADRGLSGPSATKFEKAELSRHQITPKEPWSVANSGLPSGSTRSECRHLTRVERLRRHANPEEPRTEPSLPAPARSTRRIRAALFAATGCIAAGCIGIAAVVGGWLVAEKSPSSNNSPIGLERVAQAVSGEIRGVPAASIGDPIEFAQGESGLATGAPSGQERRSGVVRLPDETLAALLRRGDESLALGDMSAARLLYERAATGGSARAATAAGRTYDPIFFDAAGVHGLAPDAEKALAWYRKAIELGDREAAARLKWLQLFQRGIGRESTGVMDDEPDKAMDVELGFATKAAQDQTVGPETSKAGRPLFQQPRQPSTPLSSSTNRDVASRLAAMIKMSNLSDHQKMIIQVASALGAGEFCLGQGVDYRDLAETMIAGWRRDSKLVDVSTQMSIDFGVQIGREGRVYEYRKSTVIDLATIPDPKSSCNLIHREVVRYSQAKLP